MAGMGLALPGTAGVPTAPQPPANYQPPAPAPSWQETLFGKPALDSYAQAQAAGAAGDVPRAIGLGVREVGQGAANVIAQPLGMIVGGAARALGGFGAGLLGYSPSTGNPAPAAVAAAASAGKPVAVAAPAIVAPAAAATPAQGMTPPSPAATTQPALAEIARWPDPAGGRGGMLPLGVVRALQGVQQTQQTLAAGALTNDTKAKLAQIEQGRIGQAINDTRNNPANRAVNEQIAVRALLEQLGAGMPQALQQSATFGGGMSQ